MTILNSKTHFKSCASRTRINVFLYIQLFILLLYIQMTLSSEINTSSSKNKCKERHLGLCQRQNIVNGTVFVVFLPHNLLLTEEEDINITYTVSGSHEVNNITLYFNHVGDDILGPLITQNFTINITSYNQSFDLAIKALSDGHTTLYASSESDPANMTNTNDAFVRIAVHYSKDLDVLSDVVGWAYFIAWSISFYPQTYLNWKRKSVIGLHFDFLALNVIGFGVYSLFNIGLFWITAIEEEYLKRHQYGVNPVQLNDVIFSIHALFACLIQVIQCIIYERGDQMISRTAKSIIGGLAIISIISTIMGGINTITWLDFLYILSYIKLFITLIKYIPQAYFNYLRKSTSGWSIGNIVLDLFGGALSILQMVILACNYNDWSSLFGDATKFGLGFFSIIFDIFFMVQHYVLYKNAADKYETLSESSATDGSVGTQSREESPELSRPNNSVLNYGSTTASVYEE